MLKIFVFSDPKDTESVGEFEIHATPMCRAKKLEIVRADQIPAEQHESEMSNSNLVLIFLSRFFLASEMFCSPGMDLARQMLETQRARLVFLLVDPCNVKDTWIEGKVLLPRNEKAISKQDADTAWVLIFEEIRNMMKDWLKS